MEDLLFILAAVILSVCYDIMMKPSLNPQQDIYVPIDKNEPVESSYNKARDLTANTIKERLLNIINSDISDKREKIISLLIQLERLEDPDMFIQENEHIRSYIFNTC